MLEKEGLKREEFTGTDQEWSQLQDDISFTKEKLSFDSGNANNELEAIKAKALTPGPQQPQKTPAELKADQDKIDAEIDNALLFDKLAIPLAEGEYEMEVTDQDKAEIRGYMQDIPKLLNDLLGIDIDKQHTDQEKLSAAVAWIVSHKRVGDLLTKHGVESKNKEIVTTKLENPKTGITPNRQSASDEKETGATFV